MATRREIELEKERKIHEKLDAILERLLEIKAAGIEPSKKASAKVKK